MWKNPNSCNLKNVPDILPQKIQFFFKFFKKIWELQEFIMKVFWRAQIDCSSKKLCIEIRDITNRLPIRTCFFQMSVRFLWLSMKLNRLHVHSKLWSYYFSEMKNKLKCKQVNNKQTIESALFYTYRYKLETSKIIFLFSFQFTHKIIISLFIHFRSVLSSYRNIDKIVIRWFY